MCFFKSKKIKYTKIVSHFKGISKNDQITNYAAAHMMGGFDGMVHAHLLNKEQCSKTVFEITYVDGSKQNITVPDESPQYNKYIQFLKR